MCLRFIHSSFKWPVTTASNINNPHFQGKIHIYDKPAGSGIPTLLRGLRSQDHRGGTWCPLAGTHRARTEVRRASSAALRKTRS